MPERVLDQLRATRRSRPTRVRALAAADHGRRADDLRQDPRDRSAGSARTRSTRSTRRSHRRASTSSTTSCSSPALGWCEQVSSSLTVLARSVGIPARLATGFVPGETRRSLRPLRRARARRARVDRDLLPGRRLAGLRPDRVGAPRGRSRRPRLVDGHRARRTRSRSRSCSAALVWLVVSAPDLLARLRPPASRRARRGRAASQRTLERIGRRAGPAARTRRDAPRVRRARSRRRSATPASRPSATSIDRETFAAGGADPAARAAADADPRRRRRRRPKRCTSRTCAVGVWSRVGPSPNIACGLARWRGSETGLLSSTEP